MDQSIANLVIQTQIVERPAHVPIGGIFVAGLVVAVHHVIVELLLSPGGTVRRIIRAGFRIQRRYAASCKAEVSRSVVKALFGVRIRPNLAALQQGGLLQVILQL